MRQRERHLLQRLLHRLLLLLHLLRALLLHLQLRGRSGHRLCLRLLLRRR